MESHEDTATYYLFTQDEVDNIAQLVDVLREVRLRLKAENIDLDSYQEPMAIPRKKPKFRHSGTM